MFNSTKRPIIMPPTRVPKAERPNKMEADAPDGTTWAIDSRGVWTRTSMKAHEARDKEWYPKNKCARRRSLAQHLNQKL